MKKLVKENLNETGSMNDFEYVHTPKKNLYETSLETLKEVKEHCEDIVQNVAEELEHFGITDISDVDPDIAIEVAKLVSSKILANQILDIINK